MRYAGIQYLRGIAAAAVVLKHASHPGGALETLGNAGVDLFFVISGFVMVVSTDGRGMSAAEFIGKRCRRVLPMWWLTLILVGALGLGEGGWQAWTLSWALLPFRVADNGVGSVYWGVGWTLVFEAIFYAFFAFGLSLKNERIALLALASLVAVGALFGHSANPLLSDFTSPLLLEFLMGVAIARLVLSGVRPSLLWAPAGLMLLAIGVHFGAMNDLRWLNLGLPLAIAVAGIAAQDLPDARLLRLLGDASYSIYLLHYVPIMLAWRFIPKDSWWPLTAAIALAFGVAAYWWIERPLLAAFKARRQLVAT